MSTSYGLIVEGVYDESILSELMPRLTSRTPEIIVRPCGGVTQLLKRFPGFLKELEYVRGGHPVDKAIVLRDWSGPRVADCEEELRQRVKNRVFAFPGGVHFCCVRHEIEAWLLADEDAINSVAVARGGSKKVAGVAGDVEEIRDPKNMLVNLLSKADLPYDPKVCGEIAKAANLERLRYRCPSFRSFENTVIDC